VCKRKYHAEKQRILLESSQEGGPEVNVEKTKFMVMSLHQNAEQFLNLTIINKSF